MMPMLPANAVRKVLVRFATRLRAERESAVKKDIDVRSFFSFFGFPLRFLTLMGFSGETTATNFSSEPPSDVLSAGVFSAAPLLCSAGASAVRTAADGAAAAMFSASSVVVVASSIAGCFLSFLPFLDLEDFLGFSSIGGTSSVCAGGRSLSAMYSSMGVTPSSLIAETGESTVGIPS